MWEGWQLATCMPDDCFCEAVRDGAVRQPSNTWSSLTFCVAALAMLPGVLVLGAVALLIAGLRPAWAFLAWLPVAFCVVVLLFGELLRFPDWVVDLSPYSHLGRYPAEDVPWGAVAIVLAVAVALAGLALWSFERRDVVTR